MGAAPGRPRGESFEANWKSRVVVMTGGPAAEAAFELLDAVNFIQRLMAAEGVPALFSPGFS
jgi:hypothetical protein